MVRNCTLICAILLQPTNEMISLGFTSNNEIMYSVTELSRGRVPDELDGLWDARRSPDP